MNLFILCSMGLLWAFSLPQGGSEGEIFKEKLKASPILWRGKTRHLCQLTHTSINPITEIGIRGTDLGVSFRYKDRLCFLFGDSATVDGKQKENMIHDSIAFGPNQLGNTIEAPKLSWLKDPSGRFEKLQVKGLSLGIMEVPVEGIYLEDRIYIFFSSGWNQEEMRHQYSALAHTRDARERDLVLDYCVSTEKFINISAEEFQDPEADEPWIYLWGTGPFRKSQVYLARVPASKISDRAAYRYYQGQGKDGPLYLPGEEDALPLFDRKDMGELSVVWHPVLEQWLMTYNTIHSSGIHLRAAPAPHGPWSKPLVIFKPWRDKGYTYFMHAKESHLGCDDGLSDPGREEEWGAPYGPYMIPSYFRQDGQNRFFIVYTLSSWNPYQVHIMETELLTQKPQAKEEAYEAPVSKPPGIVNLADFVSIQERLDSWRAEGDAFHPIEGEGRDLFLTTLDITQPKGYEALGRLWQEFWVEPNIQYLRFNLYGGHGSVKLYLGPDRVRRSFGPHSKQTPRHVRWNLKPFAGRVVRLVIEDKHRDEWGFVTVSPFKIEREE